MTRSFYILFLSLFGLAVQAQSAREDYINKWFSIAQAEMLEHGIPASITLAQGILESASGQSELAKKSNNHFGIKCHRDWEGDKVYYDDDEDNECFRKYKDAKDSFRDHSLFLKTRSRYAGLFELKFNDYKGWAKGLKKAGYATNPKYDDLLIDLIERYNLDDYDVRGVITKSPKKVSLDDELVVQETPNKVDFVIAREGDSFEGIALLFGKRTAELIRYNELRYDDTLVKGQVVFLQPKKRRSHRDHAYYTVVEGDDMYGISQRFAIKLEKLYQRNEIPSGTQPRPGMRLKLR